MSEAASTGESADTLLGAVLVLVGIVAVLYVLSTFVDVIYPLVGPVASLSVIGVVVLWLGGRL